MTLRERVWRLVPAVFFMSAFNKPSNQRVESDRYVGARHRLYSRSESKRTELWVGSRKRWVVVSSGRARLVMLGEYSRHPGAMDLVYAVL
jgi:hypothetical protein